MVKSIGHGFDDYTPNEKQLLQEIKAGAYGDKIRRHFLATEITSEGTDVPDLAFDGHNLSEVRNMQALHAKKYTELDRFMQMLKDDPINGADDFELSLNDYSKYEQHVGLTVDQAKEYAALLQRIKDKFTEMYEHDWKFKGDKRLKVEFDKLLVDLGTGTLGLDRLKALDALITNHQRLRDDNDDPDTLLALDVAVHMFDKAQVADLLDHLHRQIKLGTDFDDWFLMYFEQEKALEMAKIMQSMKGGTGSSDFNNTMFLAAVVLVNSFFCTLINS
ncbi:hypothetical protein TetV_597 [Tetraselmis virus 1]|uniref:Uncharacterized protein n=1 Tax=Tetraselmis virus 1 TaxID=2060617 RepID=A0A2P0VPD6_9VIRU|nr:hypothetical protein QJ968_gp457 [Tetraselmis virus 1]AUF82679.1 hypothetical protein TetV_597 [Tetraselmis virus 1]